MMDSIALREFLQKKYENPEAFLENVIFPVFGEDNYDTAGNYHWLRRHPEDQIAADNAGILDILVLGSIFVESSQLDVFDVTISSKHQLANNRVGIQQLIRRIISTHSGAFIIFHYKSSDRWDWRFTFCHKGASQLDSTDAKRYTFLLGPGQSCRTAAENFCKLSDTVAETGSFTMKDVIKAFDVEALSIEFFGKYKDQYEKFVSYMADERNGMRPNFIDTNFEHDGLTDEEIRSREEKPMRDYVKKLLGRIVFLYFIQKKGWLGVEPDKDWGAGDVDFMLNLFKKATKKQQSNFLDEVLEPLFEGGLNTDRSNNGHLFDTGIKAMPNCGVLKVPYLNGGLFERDASDEPESVFPAQYFGSLLEFLSQYNFTIDENDPNDAQVGIDPEMLGRIFENLLEDNKDKGTYYTPKEIVQYMCRESLIAYLQKDKDENDKQIIRNFVLSYDTTPLSENLKLEIVQKLKEVKVCDPAIGSGAFPMGILKEIFYCRGAIESFDDTARIKKEIINNNLYGVDIEKGAVDIARLRFWLAIVVDETSPEALPNLDYKVMQGNSLLESYKKVDLSHLMEDELYDDGTRQLSFYDDVVEDTREELTVLQKEFFNCSDHEEKKHIEEDIKTVINTQLSAQRISIDLNEIENIAANQEFFLWHTWFSDVFRRPNEKEGGFDIVIGNPPYVSAVTMARDENQKKVYKRLYPEATGAYDLYVLFLLLGEKLSRGVYSWIIPNKFLVADYAKNTQAKLLNSGLQFSIDVSLYDVFKNASVYPIIVLGDKNTSKLFAKYGLEKYEDLVYNKLIKKDEVITDNAARLCNLGLQTCSGATGFEAQRIKQFVCERSGRNRIPFTVSGNIDRYCYNNHQVRYMKSTYDPAYIELDKSIASSKIKMWCSPKIVIAGMTRNIEAVYVEEPLGIGVGVYAIYDFAGYDPFFILGVLNASVTTEYLTKEFYDKHLAGGYLAINKSTIDQILIPSNLSEQDKRQIAKLARQIQRKKAIVPDSDTSDLESEIDKLVAGQM